MIKINIYYVEIKCHLDATDDYYCRSYCLLNMIRPPLCPSSGAREYYAGGCCLWYLVRWFSSCRYGVELRVMCPVCGLQSANRTHHTYNLKTKTPNITGSNHLYNPLELLMMGIVVPETCWANNKICNKNHLLHLVGILFPHINEDARSKSHQTYIISLHISHRLVFLTHAHCVLCEIRIDSYKIKIHFNLRCVKEVKMWDRTIKFEKYT
jgi:hypothetical protein